MVAWPGMSDVGYRVVLEDLVPEADIDRVRSILEKIRGRTDVPEEDLADLFPLEISRLFDLKTATEWINALGRAGIRSRVEVVTRSDAAEEPEGQVEGVVTGSEADLGPWRRWRMLVSRPSELFASVPEESPWRGIVFGLALSALGGIVSLPWEWWMIRELGLPLAPAAAGRVWAATVLLQPVFSLLTGTLIAFGLLRAMRVPAQIGVVAALVGYAKAFEPLAAVPILGEVLAFFAFLWLLMVGVGTVYQLGAGRLAAFLLIPPLAVAVVGTGLVALVALAVGQTMDLSGLEELSRQLRP